MSKNCLKTTPKWITTARETFNEIVKINIVSMTDNIKEELGPHIYY